jgi:hypothetical protein
MVEKYKHWQAVREAEIKVGFQRPGNTLLLDDASPVNLYAPQVLVKTGACVLVSRCESIGTIQGFKAFAVGPSLAPACLVTCSRLSNSSQDCFGNSSDTKVSDSASRYALAFDPPMPSTDGWSYFGSWTLENEALYAFIQQKVGLTPSSLEMQ